MQQPDQPIAQHVAHEQQPLSRAEIAERCAAAPTASERRRWQVIGLLLDQAPLDAIMAATGYRQRTIREIAQCYHRFGAGALADRRAQSRGAPPLLTPSAQHALQHALQNPPPDGGAWTGPKVAQWIAQKTGRHIHRQRGWEYLRRLQGAAELGRAGHDDADASA